MPPMDERLGVPTYVAPQLPEITPPAIPPSAVQPGYQSSGPTSWGGGLAGMGASFLQGWARGKATAQANQVIKLKRTFDNAQSAYDMAARNLKQLHDSGADPNSDEYKQAQSAVHGAWDGVMNVMGQHIEPEATGKKKTKGEKFKGGLAAMFTSQDPKLVTQGYYQLMKQMGPPILHQLGPQNTQQGETAQLEQQKQHEIAILTKQRDDINKSMNPSPEQQAMLKNINTRLEGLQGKAATPKEPTNSEAAYRAAKERELGRPLTAQEELDAHQQFVKDPTQPFAAAVAAKEKELNRKLTEQEIVAEYRRTSEAAATGRRAGRGPGTGNNRFDKTYKQAQQFYRQQYPEMDQDSIDDLARRKAEGSMAKLTDAVEKATNDPQAFDSDVLDEARSRMLAMKKYKKFANFDDTFANLVGINQDNDSYAYNKTIGEADKHGNYSGAVNQQQLKEFERDLQANIRDTLAGMQLPPKVQSQVMQRMMPLMHLQGSKPEGGTTQPQGGGGKKLKAYQNGKLVDDTEYTEEEARQLQDDPDIKGKGVVFK